VKLDMHWISTRSSDINALEPRRWLRSFHWRGESAVATVHQPAQIAAQACGTVLLLLNAGPAPRAGNSDLSVKIADAAARRGMVAIRIDAPGIGDSTGRSVRRLEQFRVDAQEGPLDEFVASVAQALFDRGEADRVVLGGLCAGSVLAIRASARLRERCAGLLLLEPDLVSASLSKQRATGFERILRRVRRVARSLSRRRWGRWFGAPLASLLERPGSRGLPAGVHSGIVGDLLAAASRGTPMLVIVAKDLECERIARAILESTNGSHRSLSLEVVPETNHILTAGNAAARIVPLVSQWTRCVAQEDSQHRVSIG
jgi:pimeloyl-ACP methyl ester carboxylesterase